MKITISLKGLSPERRGDGLTLHDADFFFLDDRVERGETRCAGEATKGLLRLLSNLVGG